MHERKKDINWYELRRENWWEPYFWERHGIGMSVPFDKDKSKDYKVRRRKLKALRVYGLEANDKFLPMSACLEFRDSYLIFDRAVHNPGNVRLVDIKTHDEIAKITKWPYITVSREEKSYSSNPIDGEFPIKNVNQIERLVEGYAGHTVSKLILRGNNTAAVGLLTGEVMVTFKEKEYMRIGITALDEQKLSKIFGNAELSELYSLVVHFGKIKS
jgi:hypothetical protein